MIYESKRMIFTVTCVAARFVTMARFATKVTKRAARPARFVISETVTNCAGIVFFSSQYM